MRYYRRPNSHKGDYGHLLILAGSLGLTGAAILTSQAALRSGCGLVTLGIPKDLNSILETKLTEVITRPLFQTKKQTLSLKAFGEILRFSKKVDGLAIGPGLSTHPSTSTLVRKLIPFIDKPIILDADGINAFVGNLGILKDRVVNLNSLILTPHPGEMARLLNLKTEAIQRNREKIAKNFAKDYKVTLVLKGYRSIVANPKGKVFINSTGNPGMATAGCGDVLTGIIGSLLVQGEEPFRAAKRAVYIHGLAGDLAAKQKGQISLIASDLLDSLPQAIKLAMRSMPR